jgi:UDP-glucose 4-epimerase
MDTTEIYPGKVAIVTGARGFLGRHTSAALTASGWSVLGLGHGSWTAEEARAWGVGRWVHGPVNLSTLKALDIQPALICHCAGGGSVSHSIQSPRDDFRRTVETTMDVLEFARLCAPGAVVLYPSSAAVYGATTKLPMQESDPCNPISPYGVHKLMAEQACAYYAKNFGLRVACTRFFSIYGPQLRKQLLWDACQKMTIQKSPSFFGSGQETRDWINILDARPCG